ncbi:MAG: DUF3048 domain-containing protein, partial [Actinobacteria bacterium]|nr:DUF3048 domain-containing protein [Actinomycetota bacterium]
MSNKVVVAYVVAVVAASAVTAGLVAGTRSATPHGSAPPHTVVERPKQAVQLYSPFTGEPVSSLRPVIAVKIDNIVFARPQTGIGKADLVYVIPVEGGLSRFMA